MKRDDEDGDQDMHVDTGVSQDSSRLTIAVTRRGVGAL
jgi:hypothetical protein